MKPFQRLLVAAPAAALLPAVLAPASGLANEVQLNLDSVQGYSIAQATTIRDFSDVYPTDWAYQALSELVETYGCISGFGDGTFRGQQPITRFEMAALLNSCLDSIAAKMDMVDENMGAMEDMETLEQLVASFEEELITLKGSVDGLDAKVSEMAAGHQFSTTTKASFKIATDFLYFGSEDAAAKGYYMHDDEMHKITEDNSGLILASKAEVKFKTSFTGSDKLTFKIKGDVLSNKDGHYYLKGDNFYDSPNGHTNAEFSGFVYETALPLGGMSGNLVFGTDYADLDGIVGLETYYGGGGYDHYGPGDFGDTGVGFSIELLSSDAGTLTASASYAVNKDNATYEQGDKGIFGDDTDRSGVLALSWDGALFGGNDALFTVAYQNILKNYQNHDNLMALGSDLTSGYFHLVAGTYFTDTISLSGSYSFGTHDYAKGEDTDSAKWMIALNMDDAIFPGNSAGIAYGTPEFTTDPETDDVMQVLELYYTFKINDNFEIPVYLDFISNNDNMANADAFAFAVRPTLTF